MQNRGWIKGAQKFMVKDLTNGSPIKVVIRFAFPLFLGLILQQFYNVIDTIIVGQKIGMQALAGVGSTGSLSFMVIGFCTGLSNGFAIPIAQHFGARKEKELRKFVANSLWLWSIYSVLITILICLCCNRILRLLNTPEDIFHYAKTYIFIVFLGIPFTILYNTLAAILRAIGDSRTPVLYLSISTCLNIILDFIFIMVFHMGVEGPAIATVISQAVSGVCCLIHIYRRIDILKLDPDEKRPSLTRMITLSRIAIPMGLQTSVTGIGLLILQGAINSLGTAVVAGVATGLRMNDFLQAPLDAVAQTMAPFAGQNLGARKINRIKHGVSSALICGLSLSVVMLGIAFIFGKKIATIFIDKPDPEVLNYAYLVLLSMVGSYIFLVVLNVLRFTIQGMGFTVIAIVSGAMEVLARAMAGLILIPKFGFWGVQFAHPLAWLFGDLLLIPAFIYCMKRVSKDAQRNAISA